MSLRGIAVGLALLAGLAQASPSAAQSIARHLDMLRLGERAVASAGAVFQSQGAACPRQLPDMRLILADRRFDRLKPETRRLFLFAVLMCAETGDSPLALEAARRLEPLAVEDSEIAAVHTTRIADALARGAHAEATRRFIDLARSRPAIVAGWDPELVGAFTGYLDEDPDLGLEALRTIAGLAWTNPASARAARNEWALALGWQLADRGHAAEAAQAVEQADSLYVLLIVAGDRRFADLWERFAAAGRFDFAALARAELARARAAIADNPTRLRPAVEAVSALRALGQHPQAIDLGQAFRARLQDGETFDDAGLQADELLGQLAQALFETGRTAEAEAVFREAIGETDAPRPSVEARMALAGRLLDLDRPGEVAPLLDAVDPAAMTPFGRLWLTSLRACAQAGLDPRGAAASLDILRAGEDENPAALGQALLCNDRVDEAAALLVRRLNAPKHRAGALDPFWVTRPPPAVPPWLARFEARRQAMLNRPEVRAALARVGRPVEASLSGDYWGGY